MQQDAEAGSKPNPHLVLRVLPEGRVVLGTSKLTQRQAAMILLKIADDILKYEGEWTVDERDLRGM